MNIDQECENCYHEQDEYCCNDCYPMTNNRASAFAPKEELIRQDERNKFITLLKSDLETLDLTDDNSNISENYAIKDYIESTIELLEKENTNA